MSQIGGTEISTVGVVGAGQMGTGIAQVLAQSGVHVLVTDVSDARIQQCQNVIEKSLTKLAERGKLSDTIENVRSRISYAIQLEEHRRCQLVIEAVSENEGLKREIFSRLDEVTDSQTILATNTSSLPVTRLASFTKRQDRFIGMHFMNPVPVMSLVEIIRGHMTSDATFSATKCLAEKIGKTPVCVNDYPGFVVNRILIPMINEAFYVLMEGVASAVDIDAAMKLGTNQPMGPLSLADFIGLDTCLAIMNVLYEGLGDSKYRACPLLKKYVDAGLFGKKSGQGVYKY